MDNLKPGNSVNHSQNRQPAEANGRCCICQRVFGRGVTLIPCCNNKIHRDCMQKLFQHTPLEARSTCPLCRKNLPELTEILGPEPGDQGTGARGMQEAPEELSYELTEALINGDWDEVDRLVSIIRDAKVSLTNEPRQVLGNMLIGARKRWDWGSVSCLLGIIQDTETSLLDDDQQVLSNMLLESLKTRRWTDANGLLRIIRDARASVTDYDRQEMSNMLIKSQNYGDCHGASRLKSILGIIECSETSPKDDARRELEEAQVDLPDSCNEPTDTHSSQTASASVSDATTQRAETTTNQERPVDTLLPQGTQQLSDQGTGATGMQEAPEELSYELTEALINRDWDEVDRLVGIIRDARVSLTNGLQQVLGNMLIEARKRWDWDSVGRFLGVIQDTETSLLDDDQQVLSNMLLESLKTRRWTDANGLLRIILDARASVTDYVRQEMNNMLINSQNYGDCHGASCLGSILGIIECSETSPTDDAQKAKAHDTHKQKAQKK